MLSARASARAQLDIGFRYRFRIDDFLEHFFNEFDIEISNVRPLRGRSLEFYYTNVRSQILGCRVSWPEKDIKACHITSTSQLVQFNSVQLSLVQFSSAQWAPEKQIPRFARELVHDL